MPQLNANSSSIELLGVDQIEFVRGPQSALYGRNALGGVINIASTRPSLTAWTGSIVAPYGNFNAGDLRATASGPVIADKLAAGIGVGFSRRDGFTTNDVTGHDLDSRSAAFAKGQLLWRPDARWEARAIVTAERARDGDYALNDLAALRARPFHSSRNVEGFTHRDIIAPTLQVARSGTRVDFSSVTGFLKWKTEDLTDLDYTALPLVTRNNAEEDFQFTEEVRFASAKAAPIALSDRVTMKWQAGVFLFTQNYTQDAVNNYSPFVLSQFLPFPISQHSPQSALDDRGVGVYGQATWTFSRSLDVIVGARGDREHKKADLNTFFSPAIAPPQVVNTSKDFSDVSPQVAVAYRVVPAATVYATAARGFKAGGFNPASPAGTEAYGQEHSWNYEGGVKTSLRDRVSFSAAVFRIDWRDLQVNVPNPQGTRAVLHRQRRWRDEPGTGARVERAACARGRRLRRPRLHARAVPGRQHVERRECRRQHAGERAEPYGGLRRAVCAGGLGGGDAHFPRRRRTLRRVPIRRCEYGGAERLLAREPARRRARQALVRRSLDAERIRHALRADRLSLSGRRAFRIPRRERRAADVRPSGRRDILKGRPEERVKKPTLTAETAETAEKNLGYSRRSLRALR